MTTQTAAQLMGEHASAEEVAAAAAFLADDPAALAAQEQAAAEAANAPPPADVGAELAGLLEFAAKTVKPILPSVAALYPPEVCQAVGEALGAVCRKHGWLQDGVMKGHGEEVAAVLVVGPLALATYAAAKRDIAARKAGEKKAEAATVATPKEDGAAEFAVTVGGASADQ